MDKNALKIKGEGKYCTFSALNIGNKILNPPSLYNGFSVDMDITNSPWLILQFSECLLNLIPFKNFLHCAFSPNTE